MIGFNTETSQLIFTLNNPLVYIELGISLVFLLFANIFVFRTLKRALPKIFIVLASLIALASLVFGLTFVWTIVIASMIVSLVIIYNVNAGEVRPIVSNTLSNKSDKLFHKRNRIAPIFDKEELYDKIEATVRSLSKTSTGGLITFERGTELTDYAKSGTILNAPVSAELLVTIFYPGTRLHDGAVIIRRNMIYAAACYFDPITSGLTGKYGSRHRAALGISKVSDSVTIVVSEETGRVSLAVAGELIHVNLDDFRRLFEEYMASEAKPE
mgnify:CR=1 FL=1